MPKVSVIMPAYNDAKYISVAINSVRAQTFADWELIIIDDGSVDNSADIAAEHAADDSRIKVIKQQNQGVVAARNNAIAQAAGEFILPVDADDRLMPTAIEKMYNKISKSRHTVVSGRCAAFGLKNDFDTRVYPTNFNMKAACAITNTSMYRKSDWEKVGGYDLDFKEGIEDYAFWLSLIKNAATFYRIPELLFYFRVKDISESRQEKAKLKMQQLTDLIRQKYPMVKFPIAFKKIASVKNTYSAYVIKLWKIPVFVIPRFANRKRIKLDYCTERNFGDNLNISIARDLFDIEVKEKPPRKSEAAFIGSILQTYLLPALDFKQMLGKYIRRPVKVWGAGFIEPENAPMKTLRRFDVRAVRGKYTKERLEKYTGRKLGNIPLGDPGLLAARLISPEIIKKKHKVGIVLHYVDANNPLVKKLKLGDAKFIDVTLPTYDFLEQVAECDLIISSSMHGLIAADSLGIPNARLILSDKIIGVDYKFDDYYSAFGLENHMKINLNDISEFTYKDLNSVRDNYKITPEQVAKICEDLIKVFPYK
jgi:glycosyltransferase involved in cell wall biosynthesis